MYGLELIIIIVATLAQSLSAPSSSMSIVGLIIFWRVIMGIGTYTLMTKGEEDLTSMQELAEIIPSHPLSHPSKSATVISPRFLLSTF
jgi:hypothetical protein